MELQTPPPSYELATGVPGANKQKTPFLNIPPSAPPPSQQDDDIIAEPFTTTPILPQPYRPTQQNGQPYNQNEYQSNHDVEPPPRKVYLTVKYRWYMFGIIMTICVIVIIIGVTLGVMYGKPRSKYKPFKLSEPEKVNTEWEDKWWKDNQELIERLQKQTENLNNYNKPYK